MDIFFQIHSNLPREGPGSDASTRRAFSLLTGLPQHPSILDIGCGPGMQTLALSRLTGGAIIAIDNHQPFLDQLQQRVAQAGVTGQVQVRPGDMFALDFPGQRFDVIWSEGAIYIIGFEQGLVNWQPLLKPGGYLAVTEITWLRPDPPQELKEFLDIEAPAMQDIEANLAIIRKTGYALTGHFSLPESDWWDNYYEPLEARLVGLRAQYQSDLEALKLVEMHQLEIDLYRKYSSYYGYVFYIMQRRGDAFPAEDQR